MPKPSQPKAPTQPVTPEVETPAPDYSTLTSQIVEQQTVALQAEETGREANIESALLAREFISANPNAERKDVKLAIATAVATVRGLKPDDIISAPDKTLSKGTPSQQEKFIKCKSAYELVSVLIGIAWPTDETAAKKVEKAIASGERGFVKLKRLAAKPQKARETDPNAKRVTKENFPEKLKNFLTLAATDIGGYATLAEFLPHVEEVLEVIVKIELEAPKA